MKRIEAVLMEIRELDRDACLLTFQCPALPRKPSPGQFFMVKLMVPGFPLFGRPLAVLDYREKGDHGELIFLVKTVGAGTALLCAAREGHTALLVGPAGNHFPAIKPGQAALFVAGGTGIAAFYYLLQSRVASGDAQADPLPVLLYGARNRASLYCQDELEQMPVEMRASTEDGSRGTKGLVTALLEEALASHRFGKDAAIHVCGPDNMMKAVTRICVEHTLDPYLSLETRMACGIGVCNGCAIAVDRKGEKSFERVCHEGPVYPARVLPEFLES